MILCASLGDMPELVAVLALEESIGGDAGGDLSGSREEANRGTHGVDVLGLDGYCNGGGELSMAGGGVRGEESARKDGDASGISDRGSQCVEKVLRVRGEV